jgi:hypothetical protein
MKLTEVADREPFVVPMLRKLLEKGPVLLVIVQEGGAESVMGTIRSMKTEKDRQGHTEYVLNVFTNMEQDYAYGAQRLRRADIRERKAASAGADGFRMTKALYVPSSGNAEDLGGHDS